MGYLSQTFISKINSFTSPVQIRINISTLQSSTIQSFFSLSKRNSINHFSSFSSIFETQQLSYPPWPSSSRTTFSSSSESSHLPPTSSQQESATQQELQVGNRVSKSANIPDDQVQKVLDGVHGWSRGEFRASQSRHGMIIIQGTQDFPDKNSANTAVQNIQHQVSVNVNNAGGDC